MKEMTVEEFLKTGDAFQKGEVKIINSHLLFLKKEGESKKVTEVQILPAKGRVRCYMNPGFCGFSAQRMLREGIIGDKNIEFYDEEKQLVQLIFSTQKDISFFWRGLRKIEKLEPELN